MACSSVNFTSVSTKYFVCNLVSLFQDLKLIQHVIDPFFYGPQERGRGFCFVKCYSTLLLTAALRKGTNDHVF